jgi:PIN domain nuclease of toxin-antitoxin system
VKLLLDTVTFLDAAFAPKDISKAARELIQDPDSELFVSIATCWEITVKYSLGKLALPQRPDKFVPLHREKLGADVLSIDEESVFHILRLPDIHKDPFDRMLISQAIVHGMILLTPDERISEYPVRTIW